MAKRTLKLSALVLDYNLYPRAEVDSYHRREIAEAIRAGAVLPPVIVESKGLRVIDGFHRIMAMRSVYGEDGEIAAIVTEYASEAAMFEAAMRANAAHGRNLTSWDKARALVRAEELGITREVVADALNITRERLDNLLLERVTADGHVMKRTLAHLAGQDTTAAQQAFNLKRAGGMDQLFYINQVVALLETDSVDWSREKVELALRHLLDLLSEALKVPA